MSRTVKNDVDGDLEDTILEDEESTSADSKEDLEADIDTEEDPGIESEEDLEDEDSEDEVEDPENLTVTIGDDSPQKPKAPKWAKKLRKIVKEKDRELESLRNEINLLRPKDNNTIIPKLGEKPTLSSVDYDEDKYQEEIEKWIETKRKVETLEEEAKSKQKSEQELWNQRMESYSKAKGQLKVSDFDLAEDEVKKVLSTTQQGLIIHGSDKPELLIYALGNNEKYLKQLSEIQDPVRFAFAVAKMETQMKVTQSSQKPSPEKVVRGSSGTPSKDSRLDNLRKEAEKTGDYTRVIQYKTQLKNKN